ncbi:Undecaprenyl phosphate N,N'-diacetylbacillosamine 1-phosphate transferase [bioreactor metagenome]|uniref:Undecaprenyl phosphate N,N'-diacetylbacillosamine 1-phosphate transferase n=1 Tax=bioreactor metagenome TaxID=1076179 RepID=A0A645BFR8_9ZZZZ|nr:sugar transferase [Erysipelotrichaceae bacterium]
MIYQKYVKRFMDISLSLLGMIVLIPVWLLIIIAILIDDFGPVFFSQKRFGINKSLFNIYKFRTMKINTPRDQPTHLLENPEQYITRVGKFLRKSSLDELPQLINIFKGDMSVIGPRPALWNQDDLIAERDIYHANEIKPGLTGWAQVNGRDELSIKMKAKFDGEYSAGISFSMDWKCFWRTIVSVINHDGIVEGRIDELKGDNYSRGVLKNEKNTIYHS